jgi:hypothetical protein
MAISTNKKDHKVVFKRTSQGGGKPKTSAMNKSEKRSFKKYRGQGR